MQTVDLKSMDSVLLAALGKLFTDVAKEQRDELPVGDHDVSEIITLQVTGTVCVSPDTEKLPTSSIPMLPTLALLLKRMGIQRERAMELIREVMQEALEMGKDATSKLLEETGVAECEKALKEEVIAKLPKTPVKGQVRVKGDVLVVGAVPKAG